MRRIIRIFPLYFATIAITTAFGIGDSRAALPWTLTYTVNYYTIEVNKFPAFVGHFWTLAVEEQFYLLWPLLVLTLPKRMLLPTFLGAAAIGVLWKCVTYPLTSNLYITICPTPSSFDSLALGAILSLASHPAYGLSQTLLARWSLRIGLPVSIIYLFSRISDWFILADFGFALLCVWLLHRIISEPKSLRFLAWSPIAYIGRISYGIYVLHFFAFAIFLKLTKHHPLGPRSIPTLTVVTLICIAIASTSFWLFEKPINDLKRRFPYKRMDDRGATLTLAASSTEN